MLINGRAIADEMIQSLSRRCRSGTSLRLVAILIGDDKASRSFLKQKEKVAMILGIPFELKCFAADITTAALRDVVLEIGHDSSVGGLIVQLPLPASIDTQTILNTIPSNKDVDSLTLASKVPPCAVLATQEIFSQQGIIAPQDQSIVIIGSGVLVGRPIAHWLSSLGGRVTVIGRNVTREERMKQVHDADIIICGANVSGLVDGSMIRPHTLVIDFGYPPNVDAASIDAAGGIVTPTPGGTGPIVVAALFQNFVTLQNLN